MNFKRLVTAIEETHRHLAAQTSKAVNLGLTLRNWIVGAYIREYEQAGEDRSAYGERLLENLAQDLARAGVPATAARSLRLYRQFYIAYPEIWQSVSAKSSLQTCGFEIWQTLSAECSAGLSAVTQQAPAVAESVKLAQTLLQGLSFSHFAELLQLDDSLKRRFYEVETLRGNWSVRELKRQIETLYFERSGLSTDKRGNRRGRVSTPDKGNRGAKVSGGQRCQSYTFYKI